MAIDGDRITLVYAAGRRLYSRVFEGGEVLGDLARQERVGAHEDDWVQRLWETRVVPWYGDYFLASGYEKTKEEGWVFVFERIGR